MDRVDPITSLDNPLAKRAWQLQRKARVRRKEQAFWVDELPIALMAFRSGAPIETILYAEELLRDERGRSELEQQRKRGTACIAVSEEVFRSLCARNNPDGLGVICKNVWSDDVDALRPDQAATIVVLERISDPGNLGTILRVLDSVEHTALVLVGQGCSPSHPRAVRASRGTVFTVPICRCPDMDTVFRWAKAHQVQTVATSAGADTCFWAADYRPPLMLLFGNEHEGLAAATKAAADQVVSIPMAGMASSLNVTLSVGLLLYEIKRRSSQAVRGDGRRDGTRPPARGL